MVIKHQYNIGKITLKKLSKKVLTIHYVRDILDESYQIKDQTRQGESQKGDDAGEVDIQICVDGMPLVMIEALILDSLKKQYLQDHINKVLTKYDPNGCPYVVVIIYATVIRFESFYSKLLEHLNEYDFPYEKQSDVSDVNTDYTEYRHAQVILNRSGQNVRVHFMVAHITN